MAEAITRVVSSDGSLRRVTEWVVVDPLGQIKIVDTTKAVVIPTGDFPVVYNRVRKIIISSTNYSFSGNDLMNIILAQCGGIMPSRSNLHIIVNPGVYLVSPRNNNRDHYCFPLDPSYCGDNNILLENYGYILGGGGGGGGSASDNSPRPGYPGCSAILVNMGSSKSVRIDNRGVIAGGGGGGGSASAATPGDTFSTNGGGGAPYGPAGVSDISSPIAHPGASAELYTPGVGARVDALNWYGGSGGAWGTNGQEGFANYQPYWAAGGAAGRAVGLNSGSLIWINRGDVRGEAPA